VRNCDDPDPEARKVFEQPVLQTAQMFVGESGCWLVVAILALWRRYGAKEASNGAAYHAVNTSEPADGDDRASIHSRTALNGTAKAAGDDTVLQGWRVTMLALPAICDILATTLMNAGLLLVAASIYQMTRGALVLFVGLFSVVFLRRSLRLFQWLSLVGVVLGVAVVGLAGAIWPDKKAVHSSAPGDDAVRAIIGVLMIAGAQIFTATQFVLEEWILERSSIEPIRVVGWEGFFGLFFTVLGMIVLHFIIGRTDAGRYGPFDMVEGWKQMTQNRQVAISSLLIMISIG
jgi:drug/metabolite transporter (DMT)-like permease